MKTAKTRVTLLPTAEQLSVRAREYEDLASVYHSARFGHPPGQYDLQETTALVRDIVQGLLRGRSAAWRILDVACGTGKIARAVVQLGGVVVGVDTAMAMLRSCRANCARDEPRGTVVLTNASAADLPYRDDCFDLVFASRFLHLFSAEAQLGFIREMVRVVKPGGYVVVEAKNRWYGFCLYQLKDLWRTLKSKTTPSTYSSITELRSLEHHVGGITLHSILGLLLPKGWWFKDRARVSGLIRVLARGPLKSVSAHLVAIYQKDRRAPDPARLAKW